LMVAGCANIFPESFLIRAKRVALYRKNGVDDC